MVLKLYRLIETITIKFESSVNSDGTQTRELPQQERQQFESSVNSDGTQTKPVKFMLF